MNGQRNYKVVYTIVQRARDGKKFWLRIGAAFTNQDGSVNVLLDAMPTNGQLQIREPRASDDRRRVSNIEDEREGDFDVAALVG